MNVIGEQAAVVGEHRDPMMSRDRLREGDRLGVRRHRGTTRIEPIVQRERIAQQRAEFSNVIGIADQPRVGAPLETRVPDRLAYRLCIAAHHAGEVSDARRTVIVA